LDALSSRAQAGEKVIEFDKDDKDTLDFVASAANLRSHIFGIPLQSEWDIKQMAGNIIPAIATSNALTASLCVMEAFKIIRSQPAQQQGLAKPTTNNHLPTETQSSLAPPPAAPSSSSGGTSTKPSDPTPALGGSKMVFLNSRSTERMITTQHLMPPNPTCPVCSPVYAKLLAPADTKATLHELVLLLKEKTGFEDFSLTTTAGVIYDPDLEDNLPKPLGEYVNQATGNEFLIVSDERSSEEGGRVDVLLSPVVLTDHAKLDEGKLRLWPEELHLPPKPKKVGPGADEEEVEKVGVDGTAVVDGDGKVDLETTGSSSVAVAAAQKRKREAEEEVEEAKSQKKMKGDGDVLVVQDDEAILID
ncbi:hypothetical protein KC343_g15435, partial [Hortaea werneckii]